MIDRRLWTLTPGAAGMALAACGACCIPAFSWVLAASGIGTAMAGIEEVALLVSGAALLALSAYLWRRPQSVGAAACKKIACACTGTQSAPAPVACTLKPNEFKERSAWLRDLTSRALLSHELHENHAILRYRPAEETEVRKLVALERECCGFLSFEVRKEPAALAVWIHSEHTDVADLKLLLSHLLPA